MATTALTPTPRPIDVLNAEAMPEEVSQGKVILQRFLRHRLAVIALIVLATISVIVLLAPYIAPFKPTELRVGNYFLPPGSVADDGRVHWLGTDNIGRDYLSRLIYAGRISLTVAIMAQIGSSLLGIVIGSISGYVGTWVDPLVMRFVEFMLSIPQLPLLLIISSIIIQYREALQLPAPLANFISWLLIIPTTETTQIVAIIGIFIAFGWMGDSRLMRGMVLSLKEQTYTEAARALGSSHWRIIFRHMIPNAMAPMIVSASLGLSGFIIAEAALSFLGLGIQDPTPTWGNMLSIAQSSMLQIPWLPLIAGTPIFVCSLAFNFVGDGVRDALDPRLKM